MATVTFRNGRKVGEGYPPYVIAELNTSHFGKVEIAREMIGSVKGAGADAVKFQSWTDETLYSASYYEANPIARRFIQRYSLNEDQLRELMEYCNEKGIDFGSTPYAEREVDFLTDKTEAPFIKIASMELNNHPYLKYIGSRGVPVILSTGMGTMEEIEKAVHSLKKGGCTDIVILHCVSVYPAPPELINLHNIKTLIENFPDHVIGFSDHSTGPELAAAAVALGASVIEKHFTLDSSKIGMDNQMAMESVDFGKMVEFIHRTYRAMGSPLRVLSADEEKQRLNMRRSVVTKQPLIKGQRITRSDLTLKRPGNGIPPEKLDTLEGRILKKDLPEDVLLKYEFLGPA